MGQSKRAAPALYLGRPGTMYPHCPPGDQSEARKSMTNNYSPPRGQCGYIVPGQTGYNAGGARFDCPDCLSNLNIFNQILNLSDTLPSEYYPKFWEVLTVPCLGLTGNFAKSYCIFRDLIVPMTRNLIECKTMSDNMSKLVPKILGQLWQR